MAPMILLGVLIGSAGGALLGYLKFRNALAGAVLGACFGGLGGHFLGPGADKAGAVGTTDELNATLSANRVVLVDFYADWCPPCRRLAPTIDSLAKHYKGRAAFVKVNVDHGAGLAHSYGIRGVPTVMIFLNGKRVNTLVGCQPKANYRQALDAALAK